MKLIVYAIRSDSRNYMYVGLTGDLKRRIAQHQSGHERTTRPYRPFSVVYAEEFTSRAEARNREKFLKSGIGKELLKARIPLLPE